MTVKSSSSLTDAQAEFARELVNSGQFSSLSAVLQQGLNLLRRNTEENQVDTEALRMLLNKRRSGAFISSDEMRRQTESMLSEKRRQFEPDN